MIKVIAVGSVKEDYIRTAIEKHRKEAGKITQVEIIAVEDEKCPEKLSEKEKEEVKRKEAQKITRHIKAGDYVVALTLDGEKYQTARFEKLLKKESVCFIIGGSLGLSGEVIRIAKEDLSFGPMTYPHQLMRWILLEKIVESLK